MAVSVDYVFYLDLSVRNISHEPLYELKKKKLTNNHWIQGFHQGGAKEGTMTTPTFE